MTKQQKKSPAFQFYPSNFLGSPSVRGMTAPELGVYILLLCLDWELDGFTMEEASQLATSQRIPPAQFKAAWQKVRECFAEKRGRFRNGRLDDERAKQKEWRRKSSKGGKLSAEKRAKGTSTTLEPPLENGSTGRLNTLSPSLSPIPVTTKTTTSAGAKAPRVENWLVPSARVWEARFGDGTFDYAKHGKHLKRLKATYLPGIIAEHLGRYLDKAPPQYVSTAKFVDTFGEYAAIDPSALVDEYGCLTPLGDKETRPPGLKIA